MEKYAWKATIIDGMLEEYKKRHDNIWDTLLKELKNAGISNYSIWQVGNELFGYYECVFGIDFATKFQAMSLVVKEWNEYMKDVMIMTLDIETGAQPKLTKIFDLE